MSNFNTSQPILVQTGITSATFESQPPYEWGWASSGNIVLYLNTWGNTDNTLQVDVYWGAPTSGLIAVNANINWVKDSNLTTNYNASGGTSTVVTATIEIPKMRSKYMKLGFTLAGTSKTVDVVARFFGKSEGSGNLVQDQAAEASLATIATNQTSGGQQIQGNIASGSSDSGNPVKTGGVNRTTQPTLTDGQRGDMQLDTRGNLKTTIYAANGANPFAALADNADAVASSATVNKLGVIARNTLYNGTTYDRAVSAGGAVAAGTGTAAVSLSPTTAQLGLTIFSNTALSSTKTAVKASAGRLNWYNVYNPNASVTYLQIFNNTTASITVGTTPPDISIGIPANGGWDGESLMSLNWSTAITIAATTTPTGSTAPGTGLVVNLGYI